MNTVNVNVCKNVIDINLTQCHPYSPQIGAPVDPNPIYLIFS